MKIVLFLWLFFINVEALIAQQPTTQTIKGYVVEEASGIPVPYANVTILETKPFRGTVTDAEGKFTIEKVPIGRYTIQVSYVGYKPQMVSEVLVTSGKEVVINVGLEQSITRMNEVVVSVDKARPLNSMACISARSFSVEETRRYAGGLDDPARLASSFAGVAGTNLNSNGISIRGNSPKGVSWRLEDVDIPNPTHVAGGSVEGGGILTIFSSQMLANSDFYTGAFPAEYGNAIAGVFDMKLRNGNSEKSERTVQVGLLGIDLASEGPISKKNGSSYLFNYRYSTTGLLTKMGIMSSNAVPSYQDLSFKINLPSKKSGAFSLWGIGGLDDGSNAEKTDSAQWKYSIDRIKYSSAQSMGAIGLTHKYVPGTKTYIKTTLAASGIQYRWNYDRLDDNLVLRPNTNYKDNSGRVTASSFVNHKFNVHNTMRAGVNYHFLFYNLTMSSTVKDDPATYQNFINEKGKSMLTELYVMDKYDITEKLYITGGVHFNYFSLNSKYSIEPRLAFKWQFATKQAISVGYGIHSQLEDMKIYFVKFQRNGDSYFPNKELGFSKAQHIILGYDWSISNKLRLKIEPYLQYLSNIPGIRDSSFSMINFKQDFSFHSALYNNSRGRNIGVDFTLERFLNDNFYYLVTLSLFDSKYRADDGIWRNTRYNNGYVVNLLFGKEFFTNRNKIIGLNGRFNVLGGDHYTPYSANPVNKNVAYDETKAFEKQYPTTYFLDLTVTYRINKPKYSGIWALQIKNALGIPIREGFFYNYKTGLVDAYDVTVILPVLSYKIEF